MTVEECTVTGYKHARYADSLSEFGTPHELRRCGGWLLERPIEATSERDLIGCYPIFSCQDWTKLGEDVADLQSDFVALSLVTDPFGGYDPNELQKAFPDGVRAFKPHYVADLSKPAETLVSKHHRYYARRALNQVSVEVCEEPTKFLDEWVDLYGRLAARHNLTGIKAFSRSAFEKQLSTPGVIMLCAFHQDEMVGAHVWYKQGNVAHSHLTAFSDTGYELMASYALYSFAITTLRSEVEWLNFGAGAGTDAGSDGLTQFKRGWASDTRVAYFCQRIFDYRKYDEILSARGIADNTYFPAYRKGEF